MYNGWSNYETWDVALWVMNDESLYLKACAYVEKVKPEKLSWAGFVRFAGLRGIRTNDNVSYLSTKLNRTELTEMLRELLD